MNRALRVALGIVGGIVLTAQATSAAVTFADDNPLTTTIGGPWAPVTSTAGGLYVLSIGNSYAHYDTTVAPYTDNLIVEGFAHSEVANVYWGIGSKHNTATVNPAALGGIASVDYSHTARKASLDGVAAAVLLIQNGKYYRSAFNVIPPGSSSSFLEFVGTGLTANLFGEFVGTSYGYAIPADGRANMLSNPDFSATGAPISFGWLGHFQNDGGGYGDAVDPTLPAISLESTTAPGDSAAAYLATTAFSITFNQNPVPEPTAAVLVGLCLIPALRRRRN